MVTSMGTVSIPSTKTLHPNLEERTRQSPFLAKFRQDPETTRSRVRVHFDKICERVESKARDDRASTCNGSLTTIR